MTGIKKPGVMQSFVPPNPSQAGGAGMPSTPMATTPGMVNPMQLQDPSRMAMQWQQYSSNPQGSSFTGFGQMASPSGNTVLRAQMHNQRMEYGQVGPFDINSWQSTGNFGLDRAIDQAVDKMFFDPKEGLGLPQRALGERRRMGANAEVTTGVSGGNLSPDPYQMPRPLMRTFGARGQTLAYAGAAAVNGQTGFMNITPDGGFQQGYAQATALAVQARAYGGINPYAMAAEFGVEANATLVDLRAGFSSNSTIMKMGPFVAGRNTQVDARLYAGADAWADARISFHNGPRVSVGAGAFAGASAELAASETLMINGKAVAGGHVVGKAWAGVGAKVDVDVGLENGKLNFRFDIGAALGVGLELDFGFSIDFRAAASIVKDTIKSVLGRLLPFGGMGMGGMNPAMQQMLMVQIMQQIQRDMQRHTEQMQKIYQN